jgi:hypothetical protein
MPKRAERQDQRRTRSLVEVEVAAQIARKGQVLAHIRPGVGPPVRPWVKPLSAQEIVLDELVVGVEGHRLMVDEAAARVGADDERGHAEPVAVAAYRRRVYVVVEAAPVIPGQEDRRRAPVRAALDGVDHIGHERLSRPQVGGRMV